MGTKNVRRQGREKNNRMLTAAAAVCVLSLAAMVYVLMSVNMKSRETEFVPPPFEAAAVEGRPDGSGDADAAGGMMLGEGAAEAGRQAELEALGYSMLDAMTWKAALCGAPAIEEGAAVLYFTNPEENQVWLKVRILDGSGQVLGESGILKPGEYVRTVALHMGVADADPADFGQAPGLPVQLRIMAYEPETYHSAGAVSLSTELK